MVNAEFLKTLIENANTMLDLMQPALEAQALQLSFEAAAGAQGAARLVNDLQEITAKTVLGNEAVTKQAGTLNEAGFGKDEIAPSLQMLGTAAVGDEKKFETLTDAFSQVRNEGALTVETLKLFASAGFDPLQQMADDTGVALTTLYERLGQGNISFADVQTSLTNATAAGSDFYNATERLNNSEFGKLAIMSNELDVIQQKIGGLLLPVLGILIDELLKPFSDALLVAAEWLQKNQDLVYAVGLGLLFFAAGYGAVAVAMNASTIAANIATGAIALFNLVMSLNPIGIVVGLLAGLVAGMLYAWENMEGFRQWLWSLWEMFRQVFTNIGNFFGKIFEPIGEAITAFQEGRYMDAASAIGDLAGNLSPINLAASAAEFIATGGLTEGLEEAKARGYELGKNKKEAETEAATPSDAKVTDAFTGAKAGARKASVADTTTKSITDGGPRVININGVKFTDKIEVYNTNAQESAGELQRIFEEMFLRVLNSGASVQ